MVLVVDDDTSILVTVSEILSDEGYSVLTAGNGADALALLAKHTPDVILLDMRMPVMDGWQLARSLDDRQRAIPLVVMTAAQDARRWAAEIGAASYLAKPFDLGELLEAIAKQLDGPRPPDE
jgi:CheY-like chemotaxis protein